MSKNNKGNNCSCKSTFSAIFGRGYPHNRNQVLPRLHSTQAKHSYDHNQENETAQQQYELIENISFELQQIGQKSIRKYSTFQNSIHKEYPESEMNNRRENEYPENSFQKCIEISADSKKAGDINASSARSQPDYSSKTKKQTGFQGIMNGKKSSMSIKIDEKEASEIIDQEMQLQLFDLINSIQSKQISTSQKETNPDTQQCTSYLNKIVEEENDEEISIDLDLESERMRGQEEQRFFPKNKQALDDLFKFNNSLSNNKLSALQSLSMIDGDSRGSKNEQLYQTSNVVMQPQK